MDNSTPDGSMDGIAIIGMTGRFPGARNVEQFWHNLRDGLESISVFTEEELQEAGVESALLNAPNYVKAGAVLEDVELFDASFFGFNPREAALTDPQHRFFLECAWEALETAGYDSERYDGPIGVYAGVGMNGYLLNLYTNREMMGEVSGVQVAIGNDKDHLPTRVSYKMNLRGPSLSVQTACSSSLVAVHLACQSLLSYQCDMALAGGVSIASQKSGYLYQEGGIFSPDGHCRAFDAKAQGTVGGSGVGIVVLKRLADAVTDRDQIQAVIKGSAINNDGAVKVGYTAPGIKGQVEVIAMAQALADVDPQTISYVETHGTGTLLGDPIEFEALTQAFRASTQEKGFCAIGSLKTNVGHLDTAAGVAGLIKTVLALQHKQLPPSLHFTAPNPQIDFPNSPFYLNATLTDWKNGLTPRRAGVSAFGIGGTNAHLVIEEAPAVEVDNPSRRSQLLLLFSAKTESALEQTTANLMTHFKRDAEVNLADVAYTLQVGRRSFSHRKMIVCEDVDHALLALNGQAAEGVAAGTWEGGPRAVALMFPGQGTQYVNMGLGLYEAEPTFREVVDECAEAFQPHLGIDLREVLYPRAHEREEAQQKLDQTAMTQPALFLVEYALARMWMRWGGEPQAMIGHSVGEYVAACLSGVFTLKEAARLIALRGRLMQPRSGGAMLVVPLSENDVNGLLPGSSLGIAAVNGPRQCVVSGPKAEVETLEAELSERKIAGKRLPTSWAFHSATMDPILEEFTTSVRQASLQSPRIPFISCVTGKWITAQDATDPSYWARQLRAPVRFADGLRELMKGGDCVLLETGPGHTLSRLVRQQAGNEAGQVVSMMGRADERASDEELLMRALGQLWVAGVEIDWAALHTGEQRRRVSLPTYPFERQRYWIDRRTDAQQALTPATGLHKTPDVADWFYVPTWNRSTTPHPHSETVLVHEVNKWLIFVDEYGLASRIIKGLEQEGHEIVSVMAGEQFAKLTESLYTINPRQRDDYDALLMDLQAHDRSPRKIGHCWSVTRNNGPAQEPVVRRSFEQEQYLGFYSLLYLAQALGKQLIEQTSGELVVVDNIELKVITSNVQEVTGEELLYPEKATVLGPCKVIPQEYANVTCSSIDVLLPEAGTAQEQRLVDQLTDEFAAQPSELVVAYRGGHRWVQSFKAVRLDQQAAVSGRSREGGVYLITGGMGGLGLELAEYLAETVHAKLVLVGRGGLPEREQWEQWLESHDPDDEVSRKILKVKRLEEMGGEVMVVQADVTDEDQMRDVVSRVSSQFGDIHGVIHSAGLPPGGLIQLKTPEICAKIIAPKVQGTLVLDSIFKDTKLDFLILNSSLRSYLGLPGGVDYSAANSFLDLYSYQRRNSDHWGLTMSINWDGWQEVGMGVDNSNPQKEATADELILSAEGREVFSRTLHYSMPQVIVSVQDFSARLAQNETPALDYLEQLASRAPNQVHQRPSLKNSYVAPRNEVEHAIAVIWQELLGISEIGVDDNFFELGGDSLVSIQIVARANRVGLHLTPQQVFEHQTIAGMAAVAGTKKAIQAEQGLVTGPLPLTPIQHWFFERESPEPHHFNQAVLLEVRGVLDPALLEQSLRMLASHHDALRLRFVHWKSGWEQVNADSEETSLLSLKDLSSLAEENQHAAIEATAAEVQASLELSEGPTIRAMLFDLGAQHSGRLLIVIHHLAVDGVSWRILLEDLQTVYQQLSRDEAVVLPPKTTSFKHWASRLTEYAQSEAVLAESAYWLAEPRTKDIRLPRDYADGANTQSSRETISVSLSAEETEALLQEVPAVYRTQINDVLLTALAQALVPWTGARSLAVDLEGHGREPIFEDVDLSRTVGWFTTIFPVHLQLEDCVDDPGRQLKSIKEQLRGVPNHGMSYGLLRYLRSDEEMTAKLRAIPPPEISFLYLGQFDQAQSTASLFGPAKESSGPNISPIASRSHLLEFTGSVSEGQLKLGLTYSRNVHRSSTVERLAEEFVEALRALISHCRTTDAGGYTPSDFTEAGLSQAELDELIAELTSA